MVEALRENSLFFQALGIFVLIKTTRSAIIAGAGHWLSQKTKWAQKRQIYKLPFAQGQLRSELISAAKICLFDPLVFAPVFYFGLLDMTTTSSWSFFYTFGIMFIWYEAWFYFSHRLLHTKTFYFLHKQHHKAKVTSAFTSLSFSLIERAILLVGAIAFPVGLAQFGVEISFHGLVSYFLMNYLLNVYGHLNTEVIPHRWVKSKIGKVLMTPTYHALHHSRYNGHYGLFTRILDRAFDTEFEDYERVHELASSGIGLNRLSQRA